MHTLLHSVSPSLQQATADPRLHWRVLDTHGRVGVILVWSRCSFLLGPGVHRLLFVPSESLFPQSCVKFWRFYGGLMVTFSKKAYAIPRTAASRAPAPAAGHCWPVHLQETLKQFWLHLCGVSGSWCALLFEPSESLAGMGFDSKCDFAPSTILLGRLLCHWTWGISSWWDPTFSCQWLLSSDL